MVRKNQLFSKCYFIGKYWCPSEHKNKSFYIFLAGCLLFLRGFLLVFFFKRPKTWNSRAKHPTKMSNFSWKRSRSSYSLKEWTMTGRHIICLPTFKRYSIFWLSSLFEANPRRQNNLPIKFNFISMPFRWNEVQERNIFILKALMYPL